MIDTDTDTDTDTFLLLQSRHATVSVDAMLEALQRTAVEKVCSNTFVMCVTLSRLLDQKLVRKLLQLKHLLFLVRDQCLGATGWVKMSVYPL